MTRPADPRLPAALAERLRRRGENEAAVFALQRVLAGHPADLPARHELAALLVGLGRPDAALPHWREIARRDPGDPVAQERLGEFYLSQGAVSWALDAFEHVVAVRPRDASAWAHLGECSLALHQARQAVRALERACRLDASVPRYFVLLGRAYLEAGRWDRARPVLQQALNGPAHAEAAYWLGIGCLALPGDRQAREEEATRWLTEACRSDPGAPDPPLALGRLILRQHRPARALPYLERAAALAPDRPELLYPLSQAYLALGRRARAEQMLRQFESRTDRERERRHLELRLTQSPDDPALLRRLAHWYDQNGDGVRARALSARVPRPLPAAGHSQIHDPAARQGESAASPTRLPSAAGDRP